MRSVFYVLFLVITLHAVVADGEVNNKLQIQIAGNGFDSGLIQDPESITFPETPVLLSHVGTYKIIVFVQGMVRGVWDTTPTTNKEHDFVFDASFSSPLTFDYSGRGPVEHTISAVGITDNGSVTIRKVSAGENIINSPVSGSWTETAFWSDSNGGGHELYSRSSAVYNSSSTNIHAEGDGDVRIGNVAYGRSSEARSTSMIVWAVTISRPTTITFSASINSAGGGVGGGADGSSPSSPILPEGNSLPFTFGRAIPSGRWVDPPTTYGYRYETTDVLLTGVTGWSPELTGPVRVNVGPIDLGMFAQADSLIFSEYAQELGTLLVDGVGVDSFTVTEITPVVYDDDPYAFPIRLEYGGEETSTLSITPIEEPAISGVQSEDVPGWVQINPTASPNPFNPNVRISYELAQSDEVSVKIYDTHGRIVRHLASGLLQYAGTHHLLWNGSDDSGLHLASGVYLVQIVAGAQTGNMKITLVK